MNNRIELDTCTTCKHMARHCGTTLLCNIDDTYTSPNWMDGIEAYNSDEWFEERTVDYTTVCDRFEAK